MPVDANEAPFGYLAVEYNLGCEGCENCAFYYRPECYDAHCAPGERRDGESVYFIKKSYDNVNQSKEREMQFIIGSINKNNGNFSVAPNPKIHKTQNEANKEAERLANIHREKKFVVFEIKGICSATEIIWE